MTFDLWSLWLELLGSGLDFFRDELHRTRPDLALVVERAFDAERFRLDPDFWVEADSLALCPDCDGTGLQPSFDLGAVDCPCCRHGFVPR